jgi:hypothetical protein
MANFNQLSPEQTERLSLMVEECGEVIQAAGKILRHGYESYTPGQDPIETNRMRLIRELGDLKAAMHLMFASGDWELTDVNRCMVGKLTRLEKYLHHNKVAP